MKPTIIEPIRGNSNWGNWCKHYSGLFDRMEKKTHCDAGVEFESVRTPVDFILKRQRGDTYPYPHTEAWPCFLGQNKLAKPCPKCEFPTDEEIKAHDAENTAYCNRMLSARIAIVSATGGKHGVAGSIACPVCKTGMLKYSVSGYNGHIHAACSTDGCVRWME